MRKLTKSKKSHDFGVTRLSYSYIYGKL